MQVIFKMFNSLSVKQKSNSVYLNFFGFMSEKDKNDRTHELL